MSPKELLYTEDALGHCKQITCCCNDSSNQLSDPELKSFVATLAQRQTKCFDRFYSLLK